MLPRQKFRTEVAKLLTLKMADVSEAKADADPPIEPVSAIELP